MSVVPAAEGTDLSLYLTISLAYAVIAGDVNINWAKLILLLKYGCISPLSLSDIFLNPSLFRVTVRILFALPKIIQMARLTYLRGEFVVIF